MRAPDAGSTCAEQPVQPFGAAARGEPVETVAQRLVGARAGKQAANQRPVVEPGAADENRQPPARVHVAHDGGRVARVLRRGVDLGRVGDVDQVVRDALPIGGRQLVGADVEAAVDRGRVAVEDLAAEPVGQRQRRARSSPTRWARAPPGPAVASSPAHATRHTTKTASARAAESGRAVAYGSASTLSQTPARARQSDTVWRGRACLFVGPRRSLAWSVAGRLVVVERDGEERAIVRILGRQRLDRVRPEDGVVAPRG